MQVFIFLVGLLHTAFAIAEFFPWSYPFLLAKAATSLPDLENSSNSSDKKPLKFTPQQLSLVATIVHNAGIYNVVLAAGLFWSAFRGQPAYEVAFVLLLGAAVAGLFGTATLKSPIPAVQAGLGIIGAFLVGQRILL